MNFVAFDFETSNPDLSSICQVGLAVFRDGECVDTWSTLVNPLDYFHWRNVKVHGIVEAPSRRLRLSQQLLTIFSRGLRLE